MKWLKRLKLKRISNFAIPICLALTLIFAGFTIYGNKVGNFIVSVNDRENVLFLSENEDRSNMTNRLTVAGLNEQTDTTYLYLPSDISAGVGSKNDEHAKSYIAFGFYLINNSAEHAIDYEMTLDIHEVTKGIDNALRIMILENENTKNNGPIYAKPESSPENEAQLKANTDYETLPFVSNTVVFSTRNMLTSKNYIKYTMVIWLEGHDADCNDSIAQGSIKMSLNFQTVN